MPNCWSNYVDLEKCRITRNAQRKRYYKKTQLYEKRAWTILEDELVLAHEVCDSVLSKQLGRSIQSIQVRRSRLLKAKK